MWSALDAQQLDFPFLLPNALVILAALMEDQITYLLFVISEELNFGVHYLEEELGLRFRGRRETLAD